MRISLGRPLRVQGVWELFFGGRDEKLSHKFGMLMRQLIGAGTRKEAVARGYMAIFLILTPDGAFLITVPTEY